jgi:ubiquinone/menaquinone biosynthesis C-methylase UbiE
MTPNTFIRDHVQHQDKLLSLCCGIGLELDLLLKKLINVDITAVDISSAYIAEIRKRHSGFEAIRADALEYIMNAPDDSFDVISFIDGLEHLTKEDGMLVLEECKRVAKRKVLLFTPDGYIKNEPKDTWGVKGGDKHQLHLSGWKPRELEERGYKLIWQKPTISPHGEEYNESMYLYEK